MQFYDQQFQLTLEVDFMVLDAVLLRNTSFFSNFKSFVTFFRIVLKSRFLRKLERKLCISLERSFVSQLMRNQLKKKEELKKIATVRYTECCRRRTLSTPEYIFAFGKFRLASFIFESVFCNKIVLLPCSGTTNTENKCSHEA